MSLQRRCSEEEWGSMPWSVKRVTVQNILRYKPTFETFNALTGRTDMTAGASECAPLGSEAIVCWKCHRPDAKNVWL